MTTAVRNDPLSFAPEFDTSLMALHPFPFAYYVEPEGWSELAAMRGPRKSHYQKFVPQTHRIAQAMYSHVHERRRWGKQLDGGWVTETFMSEVNAKWGKRLSISAADLALPVGRVMCPSTASSLNQLVSSDLTSIKIGNGSVEILGPSGKR